jgi:hypothetical protein
MSNSCRIQVTVANNDVEKAEELLMGANETIDEGATTELIVDEGKPSWLEPLMKSGLSFHGCYDDGAANYPATSFACKAQTMVECLSCIGACHPFMCEVDDKGIIVPQSLQNIQEYIQMTAEITADFEQANEEEESSRPGL